MAQQDEPLEYEAGGLEPGVEMTPGERDLYEELLSLEITERPSFGPELHGQLEQIWLKEAVIPARRGPAWLRWSGAAAAILLLAFASAPQARAAFQRLLVSVASEDSGTEAPAIDPALRFQPISPETPSEDEVARDLDVSEEPPSQPAPPVEADRFVPASVTFPELRDRDAAEELIRSFYPRSLQSQGLGGVIRVALWVEASGNVTEARVVRSSGVAQLDQAAVAASPFLKFYPALHRGVPTGTWVEFDLRFEGPGRSRGQADMTEAGDGPDLTILGAGVSDPGPSAQGGAFRAAALVPLDGEELLMQALDDADQMALAGGAASLLAASPPGGTSPLGWRRDAAGILERAIVRDPGNPAPYLALGRIRNQQGLRSEALRLFNVGVARAASSTRPIPPDVVAGLHYERAVLRRGEWLPWSGLGRVPAEILGSDSCPAGDSSGSLDGYALAEDLLRLNRNCPVGLTSHLADAVQDLSGEGREARIAYLNDLEEAVEAFPGHAPAASALILELLDAGEPEMALQWADRFSTSSGGHAHAHLLRGVALHRMEQYGVADLAFADGLSRLPPTEAEALRDISSVVDAAEAARMETLATLERTRQVSIFWSLRDPVLTTPVNEGQVEHLARASYAWLRFGSLEADPSVAWLRYGPPSSQWSVAEGQAMRVVFWDYGPGPDLTFRRSADTADLRFTAESAAYLSELRPLVPRRGALPSEVARVDGQALRFRGPSATELAIDVSLDVSPVFDLIQRPLEVSVFLLDSDGGVRTVQQFSHDDPSSTVRTRAVAGPEVREMAVEFEASSGRRAVFRSPVGRLPLSARGPRFSELAVLEPRAPAEAFPVDRREEWYAPLARPEDGVSESVGVYFELYDLPAAVRELRFQAFLESHEGGLIPLRVATAGELEPAPIWSRNPQGRSTLHEYGLIGLRGLPSGTYDLGIVVIGDEIGDPVEVRRTIRIP